MNQLKIIECPRDAMQGIKRFIPTKDKVRYMQCLLKVGFDTLDFGSFVSPKVIPQMQDTVDVLLQLDLSVTKTKLLAIVANERGIEEASNYDQITYLGYPFSISEIFQMRNTGKTINESMRIIDKLMEVSYVKNKKPVIYLSMGFGNPYGDPWSLEIVSTWVDKIVDKGSKIISLSDTVGNASPQVLADVFSRLSNEFPHIEFGAHLHTKPEQSVEKLEATFNNGCRRFDGAVLGFGGCPMAKDDLTGNMPTEKIISFLNQNKIENNLDISQFEIAVNEAINVF